MSRDASQAPLALAIVISGRGSNMLTIARACAAKQINARVARVIADRESAGGIASARELGLSTNTIPARDYAERSDFEAALAADIDASGAELVVLAGFMRILTPTFTARYAGRMLNIHPSLLPDYKGLHTHQRVLQAGDRTHGVSVHFVSSELDGGPVVLQAVVPVLPGDTEDTLSARVQQQEHIIYPEVIGWIASGRLQWRDGAPWLDGSPLRAPRMTGASVNDETSHA
jgi:phosphoribosylglycinamide formyltransferase-1